MTMNDSAAHTHLEPAEFELKLLTVPDVARICGLSEKTIRRAIAGGRLPAMKLCNRMRIAPAAVAEWQRLHLVPLDVPIEEKPRRRRARLPVPTGGLTDLLNEQ